MYTPTQQYQQQPMQPMMMNPNPPILVPIIPTRGGQPIESRRSWGVNEPMARREIVTSWIPVRDQAPMERRFQEREQAPMEQQQAQMTSNLQYQSPRTKSVTLNY
jgi:hypothetical protein